MRLQLEMLTSTAAFCKLAPDWWSLWRRVPGASPFASPAWLIPWWMAFAPGSLIVLAVRGGGELVALAPFYTDKACRARPVGVSVSDYFDIMIDPKFIRGAAKMLLEAMRLRGLALQWEICGLAPHAQACIFRHAGTLVTEDPCPVLPIPAGTADLSEIVPAPKCRKLRSAWRRTARAGAVKIERAGEGALQAALGVLIRLHGLRWRGRGGGVFTDGRAKRFHRLAMPELGQAGLLDLFLCRLGERIIAVYYGLSDAERAYAYLLGFDPAYGSISPGNLLIGCAIEHAIRRGAREFHFLRGNEPYKYKWGATDRVNCRILIRGPADDG